MGGTAEGGAVAGKPMRIPYTIVRGGHRYYQPRGRMCQLGFRPMPLGLEGEEARRLALDLHERWLAVRDGGDPVDAELAAKKTREQASLAAVYPRGSIGAAWQEWIRSPEWARLAPGTRNKIWWEAWTKRIEPVFARARPDAVGFNNLSTWRAKIEQASGLDASHKALKVWRALWKVMKGLRYTQLSDPSEKVVNKAPPPRHQRFLHGEAMRLAKNAWRLGFRGLACIIAVAWDTGFAPVDCRTLVYRHLKEDRKNGRLIFDRSVEGRAKSGVPVIGTTSKFTDWLVRRYLTEIGTDEPAEAILFRMRSGVPYQESRLGGDFARIREATMPGDKRQLRDMRRSGVLETFAGDGKAENVAEKFGNTISHSNLLFATYNPVDLEKVRIADENRLKGRRKRNAT